MKSLSDTYSLSNGVKIPIVGFGTYSLNGEEGARKIEEAIKIGYRCFDTAHGYENEDSVGLAFRRSGIKREDLFVMSKLPNGSHSYEKAHQAFNESMENLGLDYMDLYLIHWACPVCIRDRWEEANTGTWKAFEEILESGRAKAIGLSNFLPHHIEPILKTAKILPMANQMRLCPGDDGTAQDDISRYCEKLGMRMISYNPLDSGRILNIPELKELAEKYNKGVNQIALRWHIQKGFVPLPRTQNIERMKSNADLFDFTLSDEDVEYITSLKNCCDPAPNPDTSQW